MKTNIDKNGVPIKIDLEVFYTIDDKGNIIYDQETMEFNFNEIIEQILPKKVKI